KADAVILAVAHKAFKEKGPSEFRQIMTPNAVLMDVKSVLDREAFGKEGIEPWRL
ncbi:MAG: nucleotide sugar dehydrogenase, partial [Gammaproteobacteria bacterium]